MPRPALLACCILASLLAGVKCKAIGVNNPKDGKGKCPGKMCNLRAAWEEAETGDVIWINIASLTMDAPLTTLPKFTKSGVIKIYASGLSFIEASTQNDTSFLQFGFYGKPTGATKSPPTTAVTPWPFPTKEGYFVGLELENIWFRNFEQYDGVGSPAEPKYVGGTIQLGATALVNMTAPASIPLLNLMNVQFKLSQASSRDPCLGWGMGGALYVGMQTNQTVVLTMQSTNFIQSRAFGKIATGGAIFLYNQVDVNWERGQVTSCSVDSFITNQASGVAIAAPNYMTNLGLNTVSLNGVTISLGKGGIGTEPTGPYVTHIGRTINVPYTVLHLASTNLWGNNDYEPAAKIQTAEVFANKIHADTVNVSVSACTGNKISIVGATNDQYWTNSFLHSECEASIIGYQVFNQDPISALVGDYRFINSSNPPGPGFADCKQAKPWLPCPSARPHCTNIPATGKSGVIGYICSRL